MSVFSIIKRGRAQAKDQKSKQADKQKDEAVKLPYRHVVTHAATDAIATAPSSWKHEDRPKIREQNRRRSAMATGGMNPSGLPRVGSNLSYVSYPSVYASSSPIPALPKNYSYSSIPSAWRDKMANTPEGLDSSDYFSHPRSYKGKEREAVPRFTIGATPSVLSSGRTSPLSSRDMSLSTGVSSGSKSIGMSGVEDEKELRKQASNFSHNIDTRPSSHSHNRPSSSESCHRLHPAHARRKSESVTQPDRPLAERQPERQPDKPQPDRQLDKSQHDRHYPPAAKSTYFMAPRPSSRRVYNVDTSDAPPIPALPDHLGIGAASSSSASSLVSIGVAMSTAPSSVISTPPPSTAGDPPPPPNTKPPRIQPAESIRTSSLRRFSFGSRRNSVDTVTSDSGNCSPEPSQSSSGRRRLSKQRPGLPAEPALSWHTAPIASTTYQNTKSVAPTERSRSKSNLSISMTNPISLSWNSSPAPTVEAPRRKLSKDRRPEVSNEQGKKHRWSWSRRNSRQSIITDPDQV